MARRKVFRRYAAIAAATLAAVASIPHGARAAEFDCLIEPRQVLEIRSPIEGLIERANVDRGDRVKKGQVIALLDTAVERLAAEAAKQRAEMEGAVRSGESRVDFSKKKYARAEELHKQNYMSAQARDEARTENLLAEAELGDARVNRKLAEIEHRRQLEIIRLKTITSPVNGIVLERVLHPGEFAEAGVGRKPIFKLADIDTLHVEVVLGADAFGKVKLGQSIEVTPEIPAGARYTARVIVIDHVLDAASGTFGVRLTLPNLNHAIPAGIRCKASFPGVAAAASGSVKRSGNVKAH